MTTLKSNLITLPSDEAIEAKILGSIMSDVNAANHCLTELKVTDFYATRHMCLFGELCEMYKENTAIDLHLVTVHLKRRNSTDKCGGVSYITDLVFGIGVGLDYEYYAKELQNLARIRRLIEVNKLCISEAIKPLAKCEDLINDTHKKLFEIQGVNEERSKLPKAVFENFSIHGDFEQTYQWMADRVSRGLPPYLGLPSYYPILDQTLGFFRPGCIYYIGARTSMGKTTFMLNLISQLYTTGQNPKVGIFSLEMPAYLLYAKLACIKADVFYSRYEDGLLKPDQRDMLYEAVKMVGRNSLVIEDEEDITISKLRARARRMVQNGTEVIYIDYLTRIKADIQAKNPNKHLQVDEISKGLQSMAKELNVPVICLAQLNRGLTGRKDFVPTLADFRESGSIEEDCDAALLLHRPDYFNPHDKPGIVQVIVAKNRLRGKLQNIEFYKSENSEKYIEHKAVSDQVKQISQEQYKNINKYDEF